MTDPTPPNDMPADTELHDVEIALTKILDSHLQEFKAGHTHIVFEQIMQLIKQRDKARDAEKERDYVKKESAEYHHQEMMRYKASLPSGIDALLQQKPAGGIVRMYEFHKSMYEQLSTPTDQKEETQ